MARYWDAPISVSVFTPDVEYAIARAYLTYLITCYPYLGDKVSVHFTYPKDHLPRHLPLKIENLHERCDQPLTVLKELLKKRSSKVRTLVSLFVYLSVYRLSVPVCLSCVICVCFFFIVLTYIVKEFIGKSSLRLIAWKSTTFNFFSFCFHSTAMAA